jgi:NAD-dependent dihydropyrimidine dehydrogenase PreA subunit
MKFRETLFIKILVMAVVFLFFGCGRWVNLAVTHDWPPGTAALISITYGLLMGLLAYFITDLVLAKGLLQFKIQLIKIILIFIIIVSLLNRVLFPIPQNSSNENALHQLGIVLLFSVFFLIIGEKKIGADFFFREENTLPAKYLRARPVKTFLETLLRLFPYPEPVGLYAVGNPTRDSPVLVTGNYDLTIRRVISALRKKGIGCWLLTCNSRGINIWCSSLAGHFSTGDIIKAIQFTRLKEKVNHTKIILPQLCAANISPVQIIKETGFVSQFGPLSIKDISRYMEDPKNSDIRKADFNLTQRLEMALGSPLILVALLIIIYNFIDLAHLLVVIPMIYVWAILHAIIFPFRPIKPIIPWSLVVGAVVYGVNHLLFIGFVLPGNNIAISLGTAYVVNEFTGWSPLLKYALIPYQKAQIEINRDLCIGCFCCIEVCPRGVYEFENKKSGVVNLNACVLCKSCFSQCPIGAINHSADRANE